MGNNKYIVFAAIATYWRLAATLVALAVGFFLIGMP